MASEKRQRKGIIYLIHCIPENKDYVGQTRRSFARRWREHCHARERSKNGNITLVDQKIEEYGPESFETKILETPLIEDLNDRESHWISQLNTQVPNGYNKTAGGGVSGRIELTPEEQKDIIASYKAGDGAEVIAKRYKCSSQFIFDFLKGHGIKTRTVNEANNLKRKNKYYRLDAQTGTVLEEYDSFTSIGRWAQENDLTNVAYASTAGMATRYAILFDTEIYGYKWGCSWTEEEKEIRREKLRNSRKKNKEKASENNLFDPTVPPRHILKRQLSSMSRKEILDFYNISYGRLDNWKAVYYLDSQGNDIEGWENAPAQYNRNSRKSRTDLPEFEKLVESLTFPTIREAAVSFAVSVHIYLKWLEAANLPHTKNDIENYLQEKGLKKKRILRPAFTRSALKLKIDPPQIEELENSLFECPSIQSGAALFGVSTAIYTTWLSQAGLPFTMEEIDEYLVFHGHPKRTPFAKESELMPPKEELAKQLRHKSFAAIGKDYGVTDNGVRKWCRKLNLPDSSGVIKSIPDDEWEYAWKNWDKVVDKYVDNKQNKGRLSKKEKEEILRLYNTGNTVKTISLKLHRDPTSISKYLKSQNIEIDQHPNVSKLYCPELDIYADSSHDMARKLLELKIVDSKKNENSIANMIQRVVRGERGSYLGLTFIKLGK